MTKPDPKTAEDLILVATVGAARGLKGEVRVKSFTADPLDLGTFTELFDESGKKSYRLKITGKQKESLLARIEGVDDRTAAEKVRGLKLFVRREQMAKPQDGEFFVSDLVGLEARLQDGTLWGRVVLADDFGAGPVIEVELINGKNEMVPFTMEVVPEIDLEKGLIVVVPPEQLPVGPEEQNKETEEEQEGETKEPKR
ncbi:MAG: ribosome maturation factor RimM [Rhodospirillaceae bacterium]|nr:ribosome maturation factor RimM [Rhodospirillaceae bacterium]